MQKLEVLIEENAFGSVRPVEVVADAPVSALIPALVEEFKLPQTDLFGQNLTYVLRRTSEGGKPIPVSSTLLASGIVSGELLALDSNAPGENAWAMVGDQQIHTPYTPAPNIGVPTIHSTATMTDFSLLSPSSVNTQSATFQPNPFMKPQPKKHSRRAFLALGGVAAVALGAGVAYATYTKMAGNKVAPGGLKVPPMGGQTTQQPTVPTRAKLQITFARHQQTVRTVAWSPDGKTLASGADDTQVFVWDTGGAVKANIDHPAAVNALAWSPDGQRLATASANLVAFFNAANGNAVARPNAEHTQPVTSLAWAAQGAQQVVSGSQDLHAVVWNTNTYTVQTIYQLHTAAIENVAWTPDGLDVASSSAGGFIRLWVAANGQDVHAHYQDAMTPMRALQFSPTAPQLAVGGDDGVVRIWNMATTCQNVVGQGVLNSQCMDVPQRIHVSTQIVRTLAWSHDGKYLAVGADDGIVSVWDPANTQRPLLTIQQDAAILSVSWSPDNKMLAIASGATASTWVLM
jgi:WD40 repeat protein